MRSTPRSFGVHESRRRSVAFGPRIEGFGSWDWVGADTAQAVSSDFDVTVFGEQVPEADVVVFIKFKPRAEILRDISRRSALVYCPIDFYGSADEIRKDADSLVACDLVLIHCERLRKHVAQFAPVEYIDHHVKFVAPLRREFVSDGPILWIGVRSNLPPVVNWINQNPLEDELWILTNPEDPGHELAPVEYGFRVPGRIRMECWTPERHVEWTSLCRGAFDVKGEDFRATHKPPAKAIDFLASGAPISLQPDSSTAEHLAAMGFEAATIDDRERWLSRDYWDDTARFGGVLRELLSLKRVRHRWRRIIENVFSRRTGDSDRILD